MDPFHKLQHLRTLFVDDDDFIRDSFAMIFTQKTCPLTTAASGEEALRRLDEGHYDIIISDYQMPGMNGLEFFQKAHASHPNSVNVLVSGNMTAEEFSFAAGALKLNFVPKPFNVVQLAGTLVALTKKYDANSTDLNA